MIKRYHQVRERSNTYYAASGRGRRGTTLSRPISDSILGSEVTASSLDSGLMTVPCTEICWIPSPHSPYAYYLYSNPTTVLAFLKSH